MVKAEQVWDRSGRKRDGYVDPGEAAYQLFEAALKPSLEALRRCQRLGLTAQAMAASTAEGSAKVWPSTTMALRSPAWPAAISSSV